MESPEAGDFSDSVESGVMAARPGEDMTQTALAKGEADGLEGSLREELEEPFSAALNNSFDFAGMYALSFAFFVAGNHSLAVAEFGTVSLPLNPPEAMVVALCVQSCAVGKGERAVVDAGSRFFPQQE
ncbi:hypothetical protein BV25DRAFT_1222028 [Artomyces pyxidatus]|uniref:Uncharacterized protein n=1 Tax=Artomyces pyxidatus TaxID=48021 RepID=A0ACB8SQM5_9AGAM|nr:hypothetical protein BV25DRAFT_1222028 [Artomyces pyxidatus]